MRTLKSMLTIVVMGLVGLAAGCGGGGGGGGGVSSPTLMSIAVTPASASVAAGDTTQFTATGSYSNGTTAVLSSGVTWTSASTSVATINASGLATGVAIGASAITAAASGVTSPAVTLTVTAATLKSIAVTPASPSVAAGDTTQFTATGTYSNGTTAVLSSGVTWTSASTSVATINASGLATGVAIGASAITAAASGVTSTAVTLTVTAATLNSITVTPASPSIAAGATDQFTATGTYSNGTTAVLTSGVTWTSASTSVATINASGLATGVAAGTSAITAAASGVTSTAVTLTVTPPILVSITITPTAPHILINGGPTQFTATGTYGNNTTANITTAVTWTSATTTTAIIGASTGLATLATPTPAIGATTVITATLSGVTASVTLIVSPAEFAVVTNFTDATVSQYFVASNGVLTPLSPATVSTTTLTAPATATVWPYVVVVDPTASFAYVANYGANGESIAQYTINKATGALTAIGTDIATGHGPNGLAIFPSPSAPYLYAVNINEDDAPYSHAISEFEYNTGSGVLSDNPIAPFVAITPPVGSTSPPYPASIAIANGTAGAYAYVADFTEPGQASFISEFSVGANGVLAPLSTPSVASGEQTNNIVVSPNGSNVYAVNNSAGTVSQYSIGTGGQLAPLSAATVAAGTGAEAIAFNPAGTYAYVANCPLTSGIAVNDGSISEYSVGTSGALTLIGTETTNVGLCPSFIAVDPSGQFLYVTNRGTPQASAAPYSNTLSEFSIGGNGLLTPLSTATVSTGNQPTGIVVFSE